MKSQIILLATLSLLAGSSFAPTIAFDNVRPLVPTEVLAKQSPDPSTRDLQRQVLLKVNSALTHGTISVTEASDMKSELDSLSESESWYQTLDKPAPAEMLQEHNKRLNEMSAKLDKNPPALTVVDAQDALHGDVEDLISTALEKNKITSHQAETFYSRLAQIESGLQAPRDGSDRSTSEVASLTKELHQMKAQLSK
ncbi:MAG TPA: hypothetical protein V6C81_22175 [Planktothrix sp.]|jgi:hypothetical protein